jgi:hypothetical protein
MAMFTTNKYNNVDSCDICGNTCWYDDYYNKDYNHICLSCYYRYFIPIEDIEYNIARIKCDLDYRLNPLRPDPQYEKDIVKLRKDLKKWEDMLKIRSDDDVRPDFNPVTEDYRLCGKKIDPMVRYDVKRGGRIYRSCRVEKETSGDKEVYHITLWDVEARLRPGMLLRFDCRVAENDGSKEVFNGPDTS